ncbi:2-C-methyl-D-erythritol 4-phosphate cytidylyltransferase [Vallicoccus soli]|uniref:2-C-methyl-D-erythritol 4-phosphate cytidylyltransferase n=1 Tax=Vallicoccus soli TaxID=2339232 RepID=A0A3A3Z5V1_9ACTN|nr:2-C-methyl-D-erythritol 4-phosphate cytidylyltransferase [Vallicoccus soli]
MLAGGSGTRVGAGLNKVYLPLAGRRVVSWSFRWASAVPEVGAYVLVVRPEDRELAEEALRREVRLPVRLVVGGGTRHASEQAALDVLAPDVRSGAVEVVAIHDGARPLAGPSLWGSVVRTAADVGGGVPALPATGVLPVLDDGHPHPGPPPGPDPGALLRVQTPQAFRAPELLDAYAAAGRAGVEGTDTSSTVTRFGGLAVRAVPGSRENLKVTYPHDLFLAERLLAAHRYQLA